MIATGIGAPNFSEGLAIGQSFISGAMMAAIMPCLVLERLYLFQMQHYLIQMQHVICLFSAIQ